MTIATETVDEEVYEPPQIIRGSTAGANCVECPFSFVGKPRQPVTGMGSERPIWIIVGEGPGQNETNQGMPFVGQTGRMVNEALVRIGVKRESLFFTNATLCQSPSGSTEAQKRKARECCSPRLKTELAQFPNRPIAALGAIAAQGFCGDKFSISAMAGAHHEIDIDGSGTLRSVIPTTHPAAILRGGSGKGGGAHTSDLGYWSLIYDLQKVNLLARGADIKFTDDIEFETTDPARAEKLVEEIVREVRVKRAFACDTETYVDDPKKHSALQAAHAKLSAIGIATIDRAISVAWAILTPRAKRLIGAILADPTITTTFHNGLYDVPVLNRHGFVVQGPQEDTLLLHHSAFPGLAHDLQRVTTQFYAISPWKAEHRHGQGSLEDLLKYNCLMAGTPVILADGSTAYIENIVRRRLAVDVMSYGPNGTEPKRVTAWHKQRVANQRWIQVQTAADAGCRSRGLILTPDHEVYTQRGKVRADQLNVCDEIATAEPPSLRYKLPRDVELADYSGLIASAPTQPSYTRIVAVHDYVPPRTTRSQRLRAETRFCLTVEDNHNFFTTFGLVANCRDTLATARIEAPLTIVIKRTNAEKTYEVDRAMAKAAAIMHVRGVPIDRDVNEQLRVGFRTHVDRTRTELIDKVFDPAINARFKERLALEQSRRIRKQDPLDIDERINKRIDEMDNGRKPFKFMIDSGDHIVAFLKACGVPLSLQTASGRISTKKDILESYVHYPEVRSLLTYRENAKLLSTFVERMFTREYPNGKVIYGFCDEFNRCHPRWSVHKITGRWGSEAPGSQNWPKADKKKGRPNLRTQVIAPPGRALVAFDAAQLEARIIALLSADPFLLDIFANKRDIHSEFARIVWPDFDQKPVDERKVLRDMIKRPEYGAFYGGAVDTLWKAVVRDYPNVTIGMIGKMVGAMKMNMPGVTNWHQRMMRTADTVGEVRSAILGRRRCFPLKQFELSEVVNFPVQSTGADIINLGLMDIMPRLPDDAFPILQIHDAVVFECHEDDAELLKQLVITSFTRDVTYEGVTVHFPVDARAGKSWAEVN